MVAMLVIGSLAAIVPVRISAAQPAASPGVKPEDMAAEVVRLLGEGDVDALYDVMEPALRDLFPRQAYITWSEGQDAAAIDSASATIGKAETAEAFTSEATGQTYDLAASVPVETSNGSLTIQLVATGGDWRWVPSADQAPVADIQEDADYTVDYETAYSTDAYRALDTYWAQIFANAGLDYHAPVDIVGVNDVSTQTPCSDNSEEPDPAGWQAFYCPLDEVIYVGPPFQKLVEDRIGKDAWIFVIGHEWAHHIQHLLGLRKSENPELYGGFYSIELETQADCMGAMWTQDRIARDEMDPAGIDEILLASDQVADPAGLPWDEWMAHGTGEQRVNAVNIGLVDGFVGCNLSPYLDPVEAAASR